MLNPGVVLTQSRNIMARAAERYRSPALLLAFFPVLILFICCSSSDATELKFAVTSPWLCEIASFIGGQSATARPLSQWNEFGDTVIVSWPRRGEIIIAFNAEDAARFKINLKNKNLRLLYNRGVMSKASLRAAFFDPAILPFIAQEVMKTISAEDQDNYPYYQRRLAEFQSRIDSAMGVGRHVLTGVGILDLTGAEGAWVRSASDKVVRPPDSVWRGWLSGNDVALKAALDEASRRGWLLLLDPWTPQRIRAAAVSYPYRLTLPAPSKDHEYFAFLDEIFATIVGRVKDDTLNTN